MKRRRRTARWLLSAPLFMSVLIAVAVIVQYRQAQLDRSLVKAVKGRRTPEAIRLLDEGANANAEATDGKPKSLKQVFEDAWAHLASRRSGAKSQRILSLIHGPWSDGEGYVPCYTATDPTLLRALLKHGADPNIVTDRFLNDTPLDLEVIIGDPENVQLLLDFGANTHAGKNSALEIAVTRVRVENAAVLLRNGCDPNERMQHGMTLLQSAAYGYGGPAMMRLLLDHGATLSDVDNNGRTALMCAADCGEPANVWFLLQRGANTADEDKSGDTALNLAERREDSDVKKTIVRMLKQAER